MKYKSKLSKATKGKQSLRITMPQAIRKLLEVNEGDYIEWIVDAENNQFKIQVQKKEEE